MGSLTPQGKGRFGGRTQSQNMQLQIEAKSSVLSATWRIQTRVAWTAIPLFAKLRCSLLCAWSGCPQAPGKPESEVNGKFAVLRWQKAAVLAGDPPITHYIVQAKQLSAGMTLWTLTSSSSSSTLDVMSVSCALLADVRRSIKLANFWGVL